MNYFPFHIGDYTTHTAHLEPMEDLAFRRLMDVYYLRESALPSDVAECARLVRMKSNAAEVEAVLKEFFVLTADGWLNVRCDEELAKMKDKQAKAKASAQASVNARSTNAKRTLNGGSATNTNTNTNKEDKSSLPRASKKCPASFEVTPDLIDWATDNCPTVNCATETPTFRDYTFSRAITDWAGAWRNWMRKAQKDAEKRAPNVETPYQRSMREKYQAIAPSVAASNPNTKKIDPNAYFDALPSKPLEITHV